MTSGWFYREEGADAAVTTLRGSVLRKGPLLKRTPTFESLFSVQPATSLTFILKTMLHTLKTMLHMILLDTLRLRAAIVTL